MKRPWSRAYPKSRHRTLGISLGGHRQGRSDTYIGWALLESGNRRVPTESQGEATGDPVTLALAQARRAMSEGAAGVDLYLYADDHAFRDSRAEIEGMTREEHIAQVRLIEAMLRSDRIPVTVLWIDGKGRTRPDELTQSFPE